MFDNDADDCNTTIAFIKTPYQINPSKVIKGSKLTVRELLQKQKLKSSGHFPKSKAKQNNKKG